MQSIITRTFTLIFLTPRFLRELKLDSRQLIHTLDSLQKIVEGVNVN